MSSSQVPGENQEPLPTGSGGGIQKCPDCGNSKNMKYMWPSPQKDPCVELNVWRFQHCTWCGWSGDVSTGTKHRVQRTELLGYWCDGHFYATLKEWFMALEICPERSDSKKGT